MPYRTCILAIFLCLPTVCTADDGRPLAGELTARQMSLPDGFKATLFAGEPDVVQPISFAIDDRGRLWVVEGNSYPDWDKQIHDRVLIFEDTDHDGRFDKRKVFWTGGVNLTSIELGFGGVWLCALPNLIFVPDRNGDEVPDGEPEVLLDGWDLDAKHNVVNGLTWGPDGWLYGCNGILSNSLIGKPGTAERDRVAINCGVWRFHPVRHAFEVVANGTTNPWGLDFDELGEMWITNCVISHLWHVVQGAHFARMFGRDFNPHLYELMSSPADHLHWAGGPWQGSRGNQAKHSDAGGGHAHVGAMVYLGDNWPRTYRNHVFMCNLHGSRVNQDIIEPRRSSYVARHGKDFLTVTDVWFRGLELQYGPDGGVFMTDWNDIGECHDYDDVQRKTGRIYKVFFGQPQTRNTNLAKLTDLELVNQLRQENDWYCRHALRLLHERTVAHGSITGVARAKLQQLLDIEKDVTRRLRALWAIHVTGLTSEKVLLKLCDDASEHLRVWAIRFACESMATPKLIEKLQVMARSDRTPKVQLAVASALSMLDIERRLPILESLAANEASAADRNLSLMIWYALEQVAAVHPEQTRRLLEHARISLLREFLARRITHLAITGKKAPLAGEPHLSMLVDVIARLRDEQIRLDVVTGMHAALDGLSNVPMPAGWQKIYPDLIAARDPRLRQKAMLVALIFDDPAAKDALRKIAADRERSESERIAAIEALVQARDIDMLPVLKRLLAAGDLRASALRGLAAYDHPSIATTILDAYSKLPRAERDIAISSLASRPHYALALLGAIQQGKIPARDLSVYSVRQLQALNHSGITKTLDEVWGTSRPTTADKLARLKKYKSQLDEGSIQRADRSHGRAVFVRTCASCHKLFGDGGEIAPDLTGSQRTNVDYILENLLDPSAIVGRAYRMTLLQTDDGRVITGIIKDETDSTLSIQTPTEILLLSKDSIEAQRQSPLSMMPEGMLEKLQANELRDLVAYLGGPAQVPLPAGRSAQRIR